MASFVYKENDLLFTPFDLRLKRDLYSFCKLSCQLINLHRISVSLEFLFTVFKTTLFWIQVKMGQLKIFLYKNDEFGLLRGVESQINPKGIDKVKKHHLPRIDQLGKPSGRVGNAYWLVGCKACYVTDRLRCLPS